MFGREPVQSLPIDGESIRQAQLKRAATELGGRAIDGRSALGRALASWRTDLIQDLGGPDAVSTQQAAMVDLAVRTV